MSIYFMYLLDKEDNMSLKCFSVYLFKFECTTCLLYL